MRFLSVSLVDPVCGTDENINDFKYFAAQSLTSAMAATLAGLRKFVGDNEAKENRGNRESRLGVFGPELFEFGLGSPAETGKM